MMAPTCKYRGVQENCWSVRTRSPVFPSLYIYILEDSELESQYFSSQKAHKIYNFFINMHIAPK